MYISRVFKLCATSAVILLSLFSYSAAHAQGPSTEIAKALRKTLVVEKDTTGACKLIRAQLKGQKVYLIEYEDKNVHAQVTLVTTKDSVNCDSLPCIRSLPERRAKITDLKLSLPEQLQYQYEFRDASETAGLRHVLIPHPPPIGPLPLINSTYIECQDRIEERKFGKIIKYSILPGGGRFHSGHRWQGLAVGIVQVVPIPLAIYFNNQRKEYLKRAEDDAIVGDTEAIDRNFDKSQDFRKYTIIAIVISATAYAFNTGDVLINVSGIRCQPEIHGDKVGLSFYKKF